MCSSPAQRNSSQIFPKWVWHYALAFPAIPTCSFRASEKFRHFWHFCNDKGQSARLASENFKKTAKKTRSRWRCRWRRRSAGRSMRRMESCSNDCLASSRHSAAIRNGNRHASQVCENELHGRTETPPLDPRTVGQVI